MTQTTLLIALFILEVLAFGWLIIEAKAGREKSLKDSSFH